jgi:glycosyltransferase involved in cell wall biosynthesis
LGAIADVLRDNKKVKFLVAGDGYSVPGLKEFVRQENVEEQVIFAGIVGRSELKNYFSAGDIFVYASKSETQGMIISEAMYCGLPIVALNAPGVSSLVENGVNGILVSENKEAFKAAVEKLVADKNLRQQFSGASQRMAREKYTAKVCAQKMLAIYEKLIYSK